MGISIEKAKLNIKAFKDADFNSESKAVDVFQTSITPEKYSLSTRIEMNKDQPTGNNGNDNKLDKITPRQLDLEILFDRTGVLEDYPFTETGVDPDIKAFKDVVFTYEGEIHKPYYLEISWGSLVFKGMLSELNVEYKLFRSNGLAVRAVAKVKFIEFFTAAQIAAMSKKSSPDLTHKRIVNEGDTLPLMTYRIYGDSKYYLQVAKVNGLANFRKLTPGQQIWFPPLEKRQ